MSRNYTHRYKVLSGVNAGLVSDGMQIGTQEYPEQYVKENLTHPEIMALQKRQHQDNKWEGIWLNDIQQPMYRPLNGIAHHNRQTVTEEGVNYDDVYMDLCVPFDRYGNEVKVGDMVIVASKNEARRAKITKIAKLPYFGGYGIYSRKVTVRDDEENQTLVIINSRSMIKL